MNDEIKILKNFTEGTISDKEFEKQLFENSKLEALLSDETLNWHGTYLAKTNPYLYLLELKIQSIEGRLNAQGVAELFLTKKGVEFAPHEKYSDDYDLILSSQPKYIDADMAFIEKHILPKDRTQTQTALKSTIKKRFDELFKFQAKPPKWIQNPEWLIVNEKPLFFLGQIEIKKCGLFHDDGAVYLFVDQETKEIKTVKQFY